MIFFLNIIERSVTLISDIRRMDPIDELFEDTVTTAASYTAATVVVTCYILFNWGDESISQEPSLVRNLSHETHLHQLFFEGRTHTYDYLRMVEAYSSILLEYCSMVVA